MAYNQPAPSGLSAINSLNLPWSGSTTEYLIKSGYPNNIFQGDLVYQGADGFLHNASDLGYGVYQFAPMLGVFVGCAFEQPTSANPTDPANQGRSYWPAGTNTLDGLYAIAKVISTPDVIYTIQSNIAGLAFEAQGATASVAYTYVAGSGTNASGDFLTGVSTMVLDGGTVGRGTAGNQNLRNLKINRFVPDPTSTTPLPGGGAVQYASVEVKLQYTELGGLLAPASLV